MISSMLPLLRYSPTLLRLPLYRTLLTHILSCSSLLFFPFLKSQCLFHSSLRTSILPRILFFPVFACLLSRINKASFLQLHIEYFLLFGGYKCP